MKCPYAVNRCTITRTSFEYDEEGVQTFQQTIEHNNAEFVDCLKENCGAWQDGRCAYRCVE